MSALNAGRYFSERALDGIDDCRKVVGAIESRIPTVSGQIPSGGVVVHSLGKQRNNDE
jgi:hypothetical protein